MTPDDLGLDERIVVARVAGRVSERLRLGARQYGPLSLKDFARTRNPLRELINETVDAQVYAEAALVWLEEIERELAAAREEAERLREENAQLRAEALSRNEKIAHLRAWTSVLERSDGC